jgi:hypothetical protein
MSDQQFDIIFRGDIVFGHQLADVKARLQQLFKADAAKVDALFSGRPVPLKRGLDHASAQKYKDALMNAGALVDIVSTVEMQPAIAVTASAPAPSAVPLTLAQRLEQQEAVVKLAAEAAAAQEALKREQAAREKVQNPAGAAQPSWSLAPAGSYLLQPSEKAVQEAVEVDTSAISLRPEGGNILDLSEQAPAAIAAVVAPNFGVAEVGADLVSADEKMDLPLLEIELADWTLADLGEFLMAASEKARVEIPVILIPDVGLAPVGADLGQLKPQVQVVIPDVSSIRMAD